MTAIAPPRRQPDAPAITRRERVDQEAEEGDGSSEGFKSTRRRDVEAAGADA